MYYETVFIVNPDVSQENTEKLTDDLVKRMEKTGGRIVKRESWGVRPLAYSIAKRKRGHYVLLLTDGEATAINTLEQALRLEERVLRFLTTSVSEPSEEPSPILRRRPPERREKPQEQPEAVPAVKPPAEEPAPAKATSEPAETEAPAEAEVKTATEEEKKTTKESKPKAKPKKAAAEKTESAEQEVAEPEAEKEKKAKSSKTSKAEEKPAKATAKSKGKRETAKKDAAD